MSLTNKISRSQFNSLLNNLKFKTNIEETRSKIYAGMSESEYANVLSSVEVSKKSAVNNFDGGLLTNMLAIGTDVIREEIVSKTNGFLADSVLNEVMQKLLLGDNTGAVITVRKNLEKMNIDDVTIDQIEKDVFRIDPSLSNVVSSSETSVPAPTANIEYLNSYEQDFPSTTKVVKGQPGYEFKFVDTKEELIADFRGTNREITEVIVHWTAHFNDQGHVGAEECHNIAISRGFSGCSYHYIIKKDGSLQRGRPINKPGAHAKANGHNLYSIGVSFIGGYNCNSDNKNRNSFINAGSITSQQWNTLNTFLEAFYLVWPGGQVWGHNDTDPSKVDPGIDMKEYIFNKFGKKNKSSSGRLPPLSPLELNA